MLKGEINGEVKLLWDIFREVEPIVATNLQVETFNEVMQ